MHCEKNVCENLLKTLFGETDDAKSREDMQTRGIRPHLHLQRNLDGHTHLKLDAPYVLTKNEQQQFHHIDGNQVSIRLCRSLKLKNC